MIVSPVSKAWQWTRIEIVGLPAIIRPAFTLGGTGGGVAYNIDEYKAHLAKAVSPPLPWRKFLIDESLLGWKEFEMEVVRDTADNAIIICAIENIDPMGVHTGDSITVAPALTLSDREYQVMRNASLAVLREIGVETGGSNVQFAVDPEDGRSGRHRNEPAGQPLIRPRLESHWISNCQNCRQAGRRLHAR